jgi:hypothetical protein
MIFCLMPFTAACRGETPLSIVVTNQEPITYQRRAIIMELMFTDA